VKKISRGLLQLFLGSFLALVFLTGGVWAQVGKKVEFSLSFGFLTNLSGGGTSTGSLITIGAGVDFHVNKLVMISPEALVATSNLYFRVATIYPGVILNFKVGGFFFGGGVVFPSNLNNVHWDTGDVSPKINIGFRPFGARLVAYLITDFHGVFKRNLFGASMGFRF
jgi:hypothetical protein